MNELKSSKKVQKVKINSIKKLKNTPDGNTYLEVKHVCSGAIPFNERENAPKVLEMAIKGTIDTLIVHSIDRLGRNTLDILHTIQEFTKNIKRQGRA